MYKLSIGEELMGCGKKYECSGNMTRIDKLTIKEGC